MVGKLEDYKQEKINRLEAHKDRNAKRKGRKPIDLQVIYQLARCMCTMGEMAKQIGMSHAALSKEHEQWPELAETIEKGYAETRQALRKTQLDLAFSGHASMLMWLGKQYLGQSDKQVVETNTQINITVQRAMDELRNIPKEQLLNSRDALRHYAQPAQEAEFTEETAGSGEGVPPV